MADTEIFRRTVAEIARPAPVTAAPDTPSAEAVERMSAAKATAILVLGPSNRILGIVTEQDIVRRLAFRVAGDAPISTAMTSPVATISEDDFLYHAIARMRRLGLRHMPVIDRDGAPAGMLNLDSALASVSGERLAQIDSLSRDGDRDGWRAVKSAQFDLAEELLAERMPTPEIQAVLSHINRDIHRRVLESVLADLKREGKGDPPVDFCFIVMGSGGRGESYVYPDQDNGFILDDYDDRDHRTIDPWFIELAERVTHSLDYIGFPLCRGSVMATNPLWRKTRGQWRAQVTGWCGKRGVAALRLADIFFDFRPIHGAIDLASDLRRHVTALVRANVGFLRELQHDDDQAGVGLGLFGGFITEKHDPEHLGKLNLKTSGTLPLVQAARLLALREGIGATATLDRLSALHALGVIDADVLDYLTGAFGHLTFLMLRQQIADFRAGRPVSNFLHPDVLRRRERDMLVDSLQAVHRFRQRVRNDFTGALF